MNEQTMVNIFSFFITFSLVILPITIGIYSFCKKIYFWYFSRPYGIIYDGGKYKLINNRRYDENENGKYVVGSFSKLEDAIILRDELEQKYYSNKLKSKNINNFLKTINK